MTIDGIQIKNTKNIINEATRMCGLVYAPPKFGKTKFAATLNKLTLRLYNKPTLFIAVEAGEGGGTATIQEEAVDYVIPATKAELDKILAALQTDTQYAGVVLDSATETVNRYVKPFVLAMENKKESDPIRLFGVPVRSDYQMMGELMRMVSQRLINLTMLNKPNGEPDLERRKHVLITALEKVETEKDKVTKETHITAIGPDLPGAMMRTSTAMFQQVMSIQVEQTIERDPNDVRKAVRKSRRVVVTETDGVKILGDRFKVYPAVFEPDLDKAWELYWIPRIEASRQ